MFSPGNLLRTLCLPLYHIGLASYAAGTMNPKIAMAQKSRSLLFAYMQVNRSALILLVTQDPRLPPKGFGFNFPSRHIPRLQFGPQSGLVCKATSLSLSFSPGSNSLSAPLHSPTSSQNSAGFCVDQNEMQA